MERLQQEKLIKTLEQHSSAYAWEYTDMKVISPKTCIHHIYIEKNCKPIRKPQSVVKPTLKIEEKTYQRLRNKPLRGGNLQYIT